MTAPLEALPTVAGGSIVVASNGGSVASLDAATGSIQWKVPIKGSRTARSRLGPGSVGARRFEAWGSRGGDQGQFDFAYPASHDSIGGIAFAPDGTFFTFDAGSLRVQHFAANRKLLGSWGSFGAGDGQFTKPTSIAVDGHGRVYVADGSRGDAQVFEPDGAFVRAIGNGSIGSDRFAYIAVDKDGNLFANEEHAVAKFSADGTPVAVYDIGAITEVASGLAVARDVTSSAAGRRTRHGRTP